MRPTTSGTTQRRFNKSGRSRQNSGLCVREDKGDFEMTVSGTDGFSPENVFGDGYIIEMNEDELEVVKEALSLYLREMPFGMAQDAGYMLRDIEFFQGGKENARIS